MNYSKLWKVTWADNGKRQFQFFANPTAAQKFVDELSQAEHAYPAPFFDIIHVPKTKFEMIGFLNALNKN